MVNTNARQRSRDLGLAAITVAAIVIAGLVPATPEAQNRRFDPVGVYAIDIDGSPGVLSFCCNTTARGPAQPQAPSGILEETGVALAPNNCVPQPHNVSPGHGVWRAAPNGRSIQGRTLHANGLGYQKIIWSIKIEIGAAGLVGEAEVEYYDSLQNLRDGFPACTSHSMDIQGWATFPSS